ncbi:LysR family transcriptional regulator [Dactylosporangium sp. CA-233914]|uniref:LysR family transcriptional regulator n=1 Tax=Dactylosporangium sp. CA-233914 TaxID=3239934 RepID=UPI003D9321AB
MMAISIQMLEMFCAAVRSQSFSAVAKDRFVSQPHVSTQIRRLEQHCGFPLFVRSQPRIHLTEAGEVLYGYAQQVLHALAELEEAGRQFRTAEHGVVRVGAVDSAGNFVLPEVISKFNRRYPQVVVEVRIGNTTELAGWIEAGDIEIAVGPRPRNIPGLASDLLYREFLIVVRPAGMEVPEPVPVETLARLPKVIREEGSFSLSVMRNLVGGLPGGSQYVAQLRGSTAVNEAVAAGLGVALVPATTARPWLAAGAVRACTLAGDRALFNDFFLSWRSNGLAPLARAFTSYLQTVKEELKQRAGDRDLGRHATSTAYTAA